MDAGHQLLRLYLISQFVSGGMPTLLPLDVLSASSCSQSTTSVAIYYKKIVPKISSYFDCCKDGMQLFSEDIICQRKTANCIFVLLTAAKPTPFSIFEPSVHNVSDPWFLGVEDLSVISSRDLSPSLCRPNSARLDWF